MSITREPFGVFEGREVDAYTLRNANGLSARLITFGARLAALEMPDRTGRMADVVLGFDHLAGYVATDHYVGATCGRYGNRIRQGRFSLDGRAHAVSVNEAGNHLHGGTRGFDRKVWSAYPREADTSVTFTHLSPDGDEGYPGELLAKAAYRLGDDDRLTIDMSAITTAPTVVNLINHAYWNLAGHASGSVEGQHLQVHGDFYTPVGEGLLLTGEILSVAGTPFDFRTPAAIGAQMGQVANAGVGERLGGGYDHNWVVRECGPGLRRVAELWDPGSGRALSLRATAPGVHIYAGGYIGPRMVGKGGGPYAPYAGVTFETQAFPDAPNFSHFPSPRLDPGETYRHVMELAFRVR